MAHPIETFTPHDDGDFLSQDFTLPPGAVAELGGVSDERVLYDRNDILIKNRQLQTADNKTYSVTSSVIFNADPGRISHVSSLETTAFATQPEGMYVHRLLLLAKLGIEGTVVGSPHGLGLTSIEDGAHNVLTIGHYEALRHDRNLTHQIHIGLSRGAMYEMAMNRYAHKFGKQVLFSHATGLCIPKKPNALSVAAGMAKAVGEEILTIGKAIDIDKNARLRYGSTLDTSADALIVHAQEGLSLLTGEAGIHGENMPEMTFGFAHNSIKDGLSNAAIWNVLLSQYPGMTVQTELRGGHLSILGRLFHEQLRRNMTTARNVLDENPSLLTKHPSVIMPQFSNLAAEQNPLLRPLPMKY